MDTLDTKDIFRLIESIPSAKAAPFKLWLAQLGSERIDEVFDPEKAIKRDIHYYRKREYDDKWIESRIKATLDRNSFSRYWRNHYKRYCKERKNKRIFGKSKSST